MSAEKHSYRNQIRNTNDADDYDDEDDDDEEDTTFITQNKQKTRKMNANLEFFV
jgi:hypothetical protein